MYIDIYDNTKEEGWNGPILEQIYYILLELS